MNCTDNHRKLRHWRGFRSWISWDLLYNATLQLMKPIENKNNVCYSICWDIWVIKFRAIWIIVNDFVDKLSYEKTKGRQPALRACMDKSTSTKLTEKTKIQALSFFLFHQNTEHYIGCPKINEIDFNLDIKIFLFGQTCLLSQYFCFLFWLNYTATNTDLTIGLTCLVNL